MLFRLEQRQIGGKHGQLLAGAETGRHNFERWMTVL
jgi:hypothetical protein